MRLSSVIIISCLAMFSISASANWKTDVETNINNGNFATASAILKQLPADIKQSNWFEIDSLSSIMKRISNDFRITRHEGIKQLKKKYPTVTTEQIDNWIEKKQIETLTINGKQYWFRKAISNLRLLNAEVNNKYHQKGTNAEGNNRMKYALEALNTPADVNGIRNTNNVTIRFTLRVKPNIVPAGETIKAWIPFPMETLRQHNIKFISSTSTPSFSVDSPHTTIYMEQKAVAGKETIFTAEYSYDVSNQYLEQSEILERLKPYNPSTTEYKKYTANQAPHIIIDNDMKALAHEIVGEQKNPVIQAALIFDWISGKFPWAGARDYSTLSNMPKYVLDQGHGDCGQVTLLYITLTRALGIPTRWESGWMLHPGEVNYHDWAETYFEGVGWLPTDTSFGRSDDSKLKTYYKTGTDIYRLATNSDINSPLSPEKKFLRSETIDFQAGEVEWRGGNLNAYSDWNSKLEVIKIKTKTTIK